MTRAKQKQKQQEPPQSDAALIAAIAGALAIGASTQATAVALATNLALPLAPLLAILQIARSAPVKYGIATLPSASASKEAERLESTYRAQYVLAAVRRWETAPTGTAKRILLDQEKRYFAQHLEAAKNRRRAAAATDAASSKYGSTLGWYAILDSRTSKECRDAHGRNFNVAMRPAIGYPGSVHPYCRCRPGKAFATSKTVYDVKPEERAA